MQPVSASQKSSPHGKATGLRVVHISLTPLAGAPYRLVMALRRHTDCDARLVDWKRSRFYPQDLVFTDQPEACLEVVQHADIVHLHNYIDLHTQISNRLTLESLAADGTRLVRQFHSEPGTIARVMGVAVGDVLSCPLPSLVVAQFQERYYPRARVVPNVLPIDDPDYLPRAGPTDWDMVFSPTTGASAWSERWNTKGAPETARLMERIAHQTGSSAKLLRGRPLAEVLYEKARSYVVLDDLVTGSYHLSGMEGLSMAKPTIAYLDERTQYVLREVSGSQTMPFINLRLEDAQRVIKYLLAHRDEGEDIGRAGREWLEKNWSEKHIANLFGSIYAQLMEDPNLVCRQGELRLDSRRARFFALALPDLVHESRREPATNLRSIIRQLGTALLLKITTPWLYAGRRAISFLPASVQSLVHEVRSARRRGY